MEFQPCCSHAGLDMGHEALESALATTEAWVARLVCRAFREASRAPTPSAASSAVELPERCRLAIELGLHEEAAWVAAARAGRVNVLEDARRRGPLWRPAAPSSWGPEVFWQGDGAWGGERLWQAAVEGGRVAVLEWWLACGWPCGGSRTCYVAAQHGRLEVLQWARAHGCGWNQTVCSFAAQHGWIDLLAWARDNGCPFNRAECVAMSRCPRMRAWLARARK